MTVTSHDLHLRDRAAMLAMRALLTVSDKPQLVPGSRSGFDEMIAKALPTEGVAYEETEVGSVSGWWCRPTNATPGAAILYLHGGAYVLGSAAAYRHFAGQIAARAGAATFVAEYALGPERPFPAAFDDARAAFAGLEKAGFGRIALAGDSAGGGLALALLAQTVAQAGTGQGSVATGAVVLSPWIDLTLSGETMTTRADADPLLTRDALAGAAVLYLGAEDPHDRRASALYGALGGLPPVTIHVGDDEVLLDDALRYARAVEIEGGRVDVHVWKGMVHVFPSNGMLRAAGEALDQAGVALRLALGAIAPEPNYGRRT